MVETETIERPGDRVGLVECSGIGSRQRRPVVDRSDRHLADPTATAECHPAGIDEHPMEPPIERFGVAQAGELPPGGDARFLGSIASIGLAAEDRAGRPEQWVDPIAQERLERGSVTSPGALDERRLPGPKSRPIGRHHRVHCRPRASSMP